MNGILAAINSFFKKKQDDELVVPQLPNINVALNNAVGTVGGWTTNLLKAIGDVKPLPFGPSLKDVPVAGPFTAGQTLDFGKTIAQAGPRAVAAIAPTIGEAVGKPFVINPSEGTQIERTGKGIVFGNEPIKSFQQQGRDASKWVSEKTAGIPLPSPVKTKLSQGAVFLPVVGAVMDLTPFGGGEGAAKFAVKNSDELATVLKRGLKIGTVDLAAGLEPMKVAWKDASALLSKLNVDKKLLSTLEGGKVVEGEGYVLQRTGDELIANIDNAFKDIMPKVKGSVEFIKKSLSKPEVPVTKKIEALTEEGTKILDETHAAANLAADTRSVFSTDTIADINRLKSVAKAKVFLEGDIETLRKGKYGKLVESVVQSVREVPQYADLTDSDALKIALELPTKAATKAKTVTQLKEAKALEKQLKADTTAFIQQEGGTAAPIQSEKDFNKAMREADAWVRQEYPVTNVQYNKMLDRKIAAHEKTGKKLLTEWTEEYGDETISLAGHGGLKLSGEVITELPKWKDRGRALLNISTPTRNIEDVAGKEAPKLKEFFFDRVAKDTQNIMNDLKGIKEGIQNKIVKGLGITAGSEADKLVFRYGEGKMTLDELKAAAPENWQKIVEADAYFRNFYDTMLKRINDVITRFGYDPILRRNDYYTHYQEIGSIFDSLGAVFRSSELPSWLSGLTADFKPGKQFFRFAQPRLGIKATESAIGAIDKYLEPALNQIYRTETIQRGRLLERALRDSLQLRDDVDPTHLTNFMGWLGDYINTLSGKKSLLARGSEGMFGRPVYGLVDAIRKKTSANLVGGNISSAITNYIPFTQALATTDKASFLKGMMHATVAPLTEANNFVIDGVQSTFLRNRFGTENLAPTFWQNVGEKATWLFTSIDKFVANTIVTGKYYEALKKGLNAEEAMATADKYSAAIMADRSFGQLPQVFQNQGLLGLLTQYQVEVNNQLQFMFRDIPKGEILINQAPSFIKTASTLAQISIYSWVFNNLFEYMTGRRPAFDPIDMVATSVEETLSDKAPDAKRMAIAQNIGQNLPFVQVFLKGGRIPIAAGIPTASAIQNNPLDALLKFGALYGAPVGGYQAYKTMEGIEAVSKGYETDSQGRVKYPIQQDLMNVIRAILFGKYSFPEANEFYKKSLSPLGVDQTIVIKRLLKTDPEAARTYYDNLMRYKELTAGSSQISEAKNKLKLIMGDPDASLEEKQKAYSELMQVVGDVRAKVIDATTNQPAGTITQPQVQKVDDQLIKSATTGLDISPQDLIKDLGPIDLSKMITTAKTALKGVSFARPKVNTKVSAIKIKPITFKFSKATKKAKGISLKPVGTPKTGVTMARKTA